MLHKICGTIVSVSVVPEYENEAEQEIDIHLDSGPIIEMCVTEDVVESLKGRINSLASFDVTDRTPCGQHARAISVEFVN